MYVQGKNVLSSPQTDGMCVYLRLRLPPTPPSGGRRVGGGGGGGGQEKRSDDRE